MRRDPANPYAKELDELEARFPGWQFWAVPHGNPRTEYVTWSARPCLLINAGSPEELAERIRIAHSSPPDGSPALASWRSYRARLRALRDFEEAAGAAWRKMRAEADQWRRLPRRHRERRAAEPQAAAPSPSPDITA